MGILLRITTNTAKLFTIRNEQWEVDRSCIDVIRLILKLRNVRSSHIVYSHLYLWPLVVSLLKS